MDWIVIVACICLPLGFLFGRMTADRRRELAGLQRDVRDSKRPKLLPSVERFGTIPPLRDAVAAELRRTH